MTEVSSVEVRGKDPEKTGWLVVGAMLVTYAVWKGIQYYLDLTD